MRAPANNSDAPVLAHGLIAAPAGLALSCALLMPTLRMSWLALLLLAASVATLAAPMLMPRQARERRLLLGRLETALLLLAIASAALLLPLPAGLTLLALARLALGFWRGVGLPGFPFLDGVLLLGAALALPSS